MYHEYEGPSSFGIGGQRVISSIITALLLPGLLLLLWLLLPETFGPPIKEHWRLALAAYVITIAGIFSYRTSGRRQRRARIALWLAVLFLAGALLVLKGVDENRVAMSDPNWNRCRWDAVEQQRGGTYAVEFTPTRLRYAYFIRLPATTVSWRTTCGDNLRIQYQTFNNKLYEVKAIDKVEAYNRCVLLELKQPGTCRFEIRWPR